jgi:hypothetical protein
MSVQFLAEVLKRRPSELDEYIQGLRQAHVIYVDQDGKVHVVEVK